FAAEQKRARYLQFVNSVSRTAIDAQTLDEMLAKIALEIRANLHFDHIGIGLVDYNAKEIEMRAEAGTGGQKAEKRVPLGVGLIGEAARSGETILRQGEGQPLLTLLPDARSALCIPMSYGDSLIGVLNIESRRENAFQPEDRMMLGTLADLLSTALHNV